MQGFTVEGACGGTQKVKKAMESPRTSWDCEFPHALRINTLHKSYYSPGLLPSKLLRPYVALIPFCTKMWLIITWLRKGFRARTADFLTDYRIKPRFLG